MKITFLGAAHEVTGSCTLVEVGKTRFIVDCGMEQGRDMFENQELPVSPAEVDFALLTHAHIDHSGKLPLLAKNGFSGQVYATAATCSLADIMLRDSAHIQMSEAEYKTRKAKRAGGAPVEPLYDIDDVEALVKRLRPCAYGEPVHVAEGVVLRFTDIGHLLGSACIELWLTEDGVTKKLVFSGDVGNTNQPILRDPQTVREADYLVIESTYGDRSHGEGRPDYIGALSQMIQRTLDRGGNVVIPAFAVGRTQEMLYFIREIKEKGLVKGHDGFKVYVDSPLAIEATSVFLQCDTSFLDDETRAILNRGINPLVFDGLEVSVSSEESKRINEDREPKVIISASGMCDAGRIRHHLKHNLWRAESLVLFVGYQSEGTLGRMLYDGAKEVKLFGESIAVRAEISWLPGVSGHADKKGLIAWFSGFEKRPGQVFVNHGDDGACAEFTRCLNEDLGCRAYAPYSGTVYDLARGEFLYEAPPVPVKRSDTAAKKPMNRYLAAFISAAERLLLAAKSAEGRPNKELKKWTERIEAILRDMK